MNGSRRAPPLSGFRPRIGVLRVLPGFPLVNAALVSLVLVSLALLSLALAGCGQQMEDQRKVESNERSELVPAPHLPRHSISRDAPPSGYELVNPYPLSLELLELGKQRFEIFCSPCHGVLGNGQGIIVKRGFPPPPSFHLPRLRVAKDRHIYDVITQGFGVMYAYGDRVPPPERWAIVAYIRALQLSQNYPVAQLPEAWVQRLDQPTPLKQAPQQQIPRMSTP